MRDRQASRKMSYSPAIEPEALIDLQSIVDYIPQDFKPYMLRTGWSTGNDGSAGACARHPTWAQVRRAWILVTERRQVVRGRPFHVDLPAFRTADDIRRIVRVLHSALRQPSPMKT
jgi:plasmid stabilization system protein ParE